MGGGRTKTAVRRSVKGSLQCSADGEGPEMVVLRLQRDSADGDKRTTLRHIQEVESTVFVDSGVCKSQEGITADSQGLSFHFIPFWTKGEL